MAKRKHGKRKLPTQSIAPPPRPEHYQEPQGQSWRSKTWNTTKWLVVFVVGLVGFLAALYQFGPMLSIATSSPLNPEDVFSIPFIITNDGYLDLHNINISCVITANYSGKTEIKDALIETDNQKAILLRPREQMTANCALSSSIGLSGFNLLSADISMKISYRPSFVWWHHDKLFRFITVQSSDGLLHWLPQPIE